MNDMEWAEQMAREIAGQPRQKTRPLREFIAELRAKAALSPTDGADSATGKGQDPQSSREQKGSE